MHYLVFSNTFQLQLNEGLTLLAADFAPDTALAVGTETNVGREKASAAPSASRLKPPLGAHFRDVAMLMS